MLSRHDTKHDYVSVMWKYMLLSVYFLGQSYWGFMSQFVTHSYFVLPKSFIWNSFYFHETFNHISFH